MYQNITLEMSVKPFKQTDGTYIEQICKNVFQQWRPLVKHAQNVSVLLWTSDGSEILDYDGNEDTAFE